MKSARHQFIAVMGAWMGAAGIEHGVGEILQGNVAPEGLFIRSWPHSAFFQSLNGEPAMTILPNFLLTGILAVAFSLLFAGWAIFFIERKHGRSTLILFAIAMLLFGGGIFPPILGMLIGAAASGFRQQMDTKPAARINLFLGRVWRWIFWICCIFWVALFPGVAVLSYFFGIDSEPVTLAILAAALLFLFLAYWSSIQHDRLQRIRQENTIKKPALDQPEARSVARQTS